MQSLVTDVQIEAAIETHDDPSHPKAVTVDEVRDLLDVLAEAAREGWSEYLDKIEQDYTFVAETDGYLVLDTGEMCLYDEELKTLADRIGVDYDDVAAAVINHLVHEIARDITAYDWSYSYPMVLPLPDGAEAGQRVVEAIMTGLLRRGLSPGQAWAYYGVEIRGYSRNQWANRCGYSDHSAVSEPLRKAKKKLPA